ncbi:DUF4185 domain-containing protein [Rhodococcus sp. 24CO]|uniref:DUF4185 domain-containing protein n=1 Tax=Rhodococcus sp. 24CO TaxID=3117460 RepID=UPI003D333E9D
MKQSWKLPVVALACAFVPAAVVTTTAHASPWGCNISAIFDKSGGPTNPIPWLNGTDGNLPDLQGRTSAVEYITGALSPNQTVERFNVLGTDLGIMWDNGAGQVLTVFGDTVGLNSDPTCGGVVGDWRSNVLFRSADGILSDGMNIDSSPVDRPNRSREIIDSLKVTGVETSSIPTTGIAVGGVQYVNYMSVRSWGGSGEWVTNFSQIASSRDNGETWQVEPASARPNLPLTGNANFQMGSFVKDGGYVYNFGTPSGRFGEARLSRVKEESIVDVAAYEYWDGKSWVPNKPDVATPVLDGDVSELSVQYNNYLGKFVAMYSNEWGALVLRTADQLTGPWSAPDIVIEPGAVPGLYGAYMHPWSQGQDLYFLATTWSDYNVMLMKTTL